MVNTYPYFIDGRIRVTTEMVLLGVIIGRRGVYEFDYSHTWKFFYFFPFLIKNGAHCHS